MNCTTYLAKTKALIICANYPAADLRILFSHMKKASFSRDAAYIEVMFEGVFTT